MRRLPAVFCPPSRPYVHDNARPSQLLTVISSHWTRSRRVCRRTSSRALPRAFAIHTKLRGSEAFFEALRHRWQALHLFEQFLSRSTSSQNTCMHHGPSGTLEPTPSSTSTLQEHIPRSRQLLVLVPQAQLLGPSSRW